MSGPDRQPSVLFIVRGDDTVPSCRFRAYQFREPLSRSGMRADYLRIERGNNPLAHARFLSALARLPRRYDAVVYQKSLHAARIRVASFANANLFYDFDDALYVSDSEAKFARTVRAAPRVIAGNEVLAERARRYNARVAIVPTTITLPDVVPNPDRVGPLRLSWIGTADNLPYLAPVLDALPRLRAEGTPVELHVLTEKPERVAAAADVVVERWSPQAEPLAFARCEVGLMPLRDDAWSRGKCACKALQYLSYSRPVITSPVGLNREIFAEQPFGLMVGGDSDWKDAIRALAKRRAELPALAASGRELVAREYDVEVWAPRLRDLLLSPS
jgi:glycosyltransferase involved in cell wall biosynthesis